MSDFDNNFNGILSLSRDPRLIGSFIEKSRILYYNRFGSDDSDKILNAKRLLDVAVLIYVTEKEVCNNMDTTYGSYGRKGAFNTDEITENTFCHANMRRVLESIKRYTDENGILTLDANLVTAIRDAIMTCNYYKTSTQKDIPEVFTNLANLNLKEKNSVLFEKYVGEILKIEVDPKKPKEFKIVLHSGFQKKVLGMRPGPSPKNNDTDGVFICKLRAAILAFLEFYNIKYYKSERFDDFDSECLDAITNEVLPVGGGSSRRRKAYKTTRRNNKNKNKKQYRRKRHTKRCKKSHRRSRR